MSLNTPVIFLQWQVKMSAEKKPIVHAFPTWTSHNDRCENCKLLLSQKTSRLLCRMVHSYTQSHLNIMDSSWMLLVKSVLFLVWRVKMSAVKNVSKLRWTKRAQFLYVHAFCMLLAGKEGGDSPGDWGLGGTTASLFGDDGRERVTSELRWNSFLPTVNQQGYN